MLAELDGAAAPQGHRFTALSEERGEIDYGDPRRARDHRPDRRLAERQARPPHHALSIAVADGDDDGRRRVRVRPRLRPARGVVGAPRRGRLAQRRAARSRARASAAAATAASRCSGSSPPTRAGSRPRSTRCVERRLPAARARHDRLVALPGRRRAVRRHGVAAPLPRRRRRRRTADRARGRRPRQLPALRTTRSAAPLDADPTLAGGRGAHAGDAARARGDPGMIDWILAERIAGYVAGTGDGQPPDVGPGRARRRVRAPRRRPTPACSRRGRCRRPRASAAGSGSRATSPRCGRCSIRCSSAPASGLGPLRPAMQLGVGVRARTEVGVVARLPGPARARPVRAGAARRGRRGPPAAAAVRAAQPRPGGRRRSAPRRRSS